jgi:hypothetical protein
MSIECIECGQDIPVPPKFPLTFKTVDGKQVVVCDYTQAYEHMKTHPNLWTDALAKEYEDWKQGELDE